jgi:hypothetical protein
MSEKCIQISDNGFIESALLAADIGYRSGSSLHGSALLTVVPDSMRSDAARVTRLKVLSDSFCARVLFAAALGLLVPVMARAQATGTISGLVTDATDAAPPSVALELTNRATGLVRRSTTGPDGVYVVPLLPPGVYDVRASLTGFSTMVREGVPVSVSETARVNLTLAVGPVTSEITVVRSAPLVEAGNATLGIVIDERKIVDLTG